MLTIFDPETEEWEIRLRTLKEHEQANLAEYISSNKKTLRKIDSIIQLLLNKNTLETIKYWTFEESSLSIIIKGILNLFKANVSGKTKFDVWRDDEPKICFGIYINPEEKAKLLEKSQFSDEFHMVGPGKLTADELPREIIQFHVLPRLLLEIKSSQKTFSDKEISNLLLLYAYHVGLG